MIDVAVDWVHSYGGSVVRDRETGEYIANGPISWDEAMDKAANSWTCEECANTLNDEDEDPERCWLCGEFRVVL